MEEKHFLFRSVMMLRKNIYHSLISRRNLANTLPKEGKICCIHKYVGESSDCANCGKYAYVIKRVDCTDQTGKSIRVVGTSSI
jgi:hypothetical protein